MIRVSVLYPNQGGKFDFDYYRTTHMNLVHKLLDPMGLVKTEVNKGIGQMPFIAIGHLIFNSLEEMQRALDAHDAAFVADLANFTDIRPQIQVSEIIG